VPPSGFGAWKVGLPSVQAGDPRSSGTAHGMPCIAACRADQRWSTARIRCRRRENENPDGSDRSPAPRAGGTRDRTVIRCVRCWSGRRTAGCPRTATGREVAFQKPRATALWLDRALRSLVSPPTYLLDNPTSAQHVRPRLRRSGVFRVIHEPGESATATPDRSVRSHIPFRLLRQASLTCGLGTVSPEVRNGVGSEASQRPELWVGPSVSAIRW
jgi:hypothetical protein